MGIGVALCAGAFFYPEPREKIVIKEIEKPVVKYVKVLQPTDTSDLYQCYMSPIAIQYRMADDSTMRVTAADTCKSTEQDIKLGVAQSGNWKLYAAIGGGALVLGGVAGLLLHR